MPSSDYREAKEAFVAGLAGSSVHTINAVSATALTTYACWAALRTRYPYLAASPPVQLGLLIVPMLLGTTTFAHAPVALNAVLAIAAAAIIHLRPHQDRLALSYSWRLFGSDPAAIEKTSKKRDASTGQPFANSISSDEENDVDEDKLRGVSSTASVSGEEGRRSISLRHRRSKSGSRDRSYIGSGSTSLAPMLEEHQDGAVTSAFRLAREGVAPSPVSQHALAAFKTMQAQLSPASQPNTSLFTPIPPPAAARADSSTPSPASTPRRSLSQSRPGSRRHSRHWSKAYLDPDDDNSEVGTNGDDPTQQTYPPDAPEARTGLESRASVSTRDQIRSATTGQDVAADEKPFRVSVDSHDTHGHARTLSSKATGSSFRTEQTAEIAARLAMPVRPFLTIYRAHMMLMTIICILAVDFTVFPREFAKCETWGTSLMDMGVGSFVFSLGLVSAGPDLKQAIITAIRRRQSSNASVSQNVASGTSVKARLAQDARRSLPILVLGFVRVLLVKSTEYPEHVSEYGVHWNFFITLGLLPFVGTLVQAALSSWSDRTRLHSKANLHEEHSLRIIGIAVLLGSLFQLTLWLTPLQAWAISNSVDRRASLLAANKEGIVSLPGYFVLYLLGLDLGAYVLPADPYLAHRLRDKRQLKSRRDRLDGSSTAPILAEQGRGSSDSRRGHNRAASLTSVAVGGADGLSNAQTSRETAQSSHGASASVSSISEVTAHTARGNGSISSGPSALHAHVLRHRPNGSLSRLSTSSDGLSSIFLAANSGMEASHPRCAPTSVNHGTEAYAAPRSHSDKLAMILFSFASLWWAAYFFLWLCGSQPSRRIANVMYVVWVAAYNTSFLLGYLLIHMCLLVPIERAVAQRSARGGEVEVGIGTGAGTQSSTPTVGGIAVASQQAFPPTAEDNVASRSGGATSRPSTAFLRRREGNTTPYVLEALNRQALAVFLLANVLTGLINLSLQTMYASPAFALLVLGFYLFACLASAIALDHYKIRLRL